jgi:hypothetical protein
VSSRPAVPNDPRGLIDTSTLILLATRDPDDLPEAPMISAVTLIAATALASSLPLSTCNPDDFHGIDGLDVPPVPLGRPD